MKRCLIIIVVTAVSVILAPPVIPNDWPIYKGNIYFTGNNDEIIVKNANLKWLFQASDMVHNPIISAGRVYFVDLKRKVYCVSEETGELIWKIDLNAISSQFAARSKAYGTVKYPLISGDRLFLTDNIAVYCFDKMTGRVIWARTGMRDEKNPGNLKVAVVDGIYSNPVITEDQIFYGTRNVFFSREIVNGHTMWTSDNIKSYSGFPSFYDKYLFTQSMDFGSDSYTVLCLEAKTGSVKWSKQFPKPHKIFSPVVYRNRVFLPVSSAMHCLTADDGSRVWEKEYGSIITSNPSFTDSEILFTLGNSSVVTIDPESGDIRDRIDLGEQSSPYFVTIRDQIYTASTIKKAVAGKEYSFAMVGSYRFRKKEKLWEYTPPFPGAGGQPAASKGILFIPAGNYLYAIGTEYYSRIVDGGSGFYPPKKDKQNDADDGGKLPDIDNTLKNTFARERDGLALRDFKLTIHDKEKKTLKAQVDIIKWHKGRAQYTEKTKIDRPGQDIKVPDADEVELTVNTDGYLPKKIIVSKKDREQAITLDRIEQGKSFVVDNILFEINEAYLLPESLGILQQLLQMMRRNPNMRIEVRGYTDSTGTRSHNLILSQRRADAVVEFLVKNGISPARVTGIGLGPDNPIAQNESEEGRRRNRRTEFFILAR